MAFLKFPPSLSLEQYPCPYILRKIPVDMSHIFESNHDDEDEGNEDGDNEDKDEALNMVCRRHLMGS